MGGRITVHKGKKCTTVVRLEDTFSIVIFKPPLSSGAPGALCKTLSKSVLRRGPRKKIRQKRTLAGRNRSLTRSRSDSVQCGRSSKSSTRSSGRGSVFVREGPREKVASFGVCLSIAPQEENTNPYTHKRKHKKLCTSDMVQAKCTSYRKVALGLGQASRSKARRAAAAASRTSARVVLGSNGRQTFSYK